MSPFHGIESVPAAVMAFSPRDDILLPAAAGAPDRHPGASRIVAFIPITVALVGVAAILLGRVTVHEIAAADAPDGIDPVATGSIEAPKPLYAFP